MPEPIDTAQGTCQVTQVTLVQGPEECPAQCHCFWAAALRQPYRSRVIRYANRAKVVLRFAKFIDSHSER
jgi:hypothetical protein